MEEAVETTLIGVLLDVSGSMKGKYSLDKSHDASVERTHALLTTIINIVGQEVDKHRRRDSIFACAFGLEKDECGPTCTEICDMITLIDCPKDGYKALVDLAKIPHAESWIRKHLSQRDAKLLCTVISQDNDLVFDLRRLLSWEGAGQKMAEKVSDSFRWRQSGQQAVRVDSKRLDEHLGWIEELEEFNIPKDGCQALVDLAREEGAQHTERWIRNHLSQSEAKILYTVISQKRDLVLELKRLFSWEGAGQNIARKVNDSFREQQHGQQAVRVDSRRLEETLGWIEELVEFDIPKDGHQALVDLAVEERAPHTEHWIRNHLKQSEAKILYTVINHERSLMSRLKDLLPSRTRTRVVSGGAWAGKMMEMLPLLGPNVIKPVNDYASQQMERTVDQHEAYTFAHIIIDRIWQQLQEAESEVYGFVHIVIECFCQQLREVESEVHQFARNVIDRFWQQQPRPRPVREVSKKLEDLLGGPSSSDEQSLHAKIDEVIEEIRPFIYGGTPMRKALTCAQAIFEESKEDHKVLYIISDGDSADGDPRKIAQSLSKMDVIIATCFLTSDHIEKPRSLIYDPDPSWGRDDGRSEGRRVLFEMSSIVKNTHTPISYLVDADWELSPKGESRLFIQANSLDVVNEFCRIVISQMSKHCDALVHVLEKINLADLINVTNAEFMPKQQQGETCYANACAAVLNLAMHRIVGREGGVPSFKELRKKLIAKYGEHGKRSEVVLNEVCPEYRLHVRTVDETGARKAINERRPVVARFNWYVEEYEMFMKFYKNMPKGILKKENVDRFSWYVEQHKMFEKYDENTPKGILKKGNIEGQF